MIIKKFQGATEMDAVLQAKEELGKDAVVLNVKKIKQRGIFKFLKSTIVEVTVALEEGKIEKDKTETDTVKANDSKSSFDSVADEKIVLKPQSKIIEKKALDLGKDETVELEKKLANLQSLLEKQIETKPAETLTTEQETQKSETAVFAQLIYNTLLDMEVDEKYINQFIGEIELTKNKDLTIDHVLSNIYQRMILKLGEANLIKEAKKKPKVVYFIGPTGVGKTTTLAKIASKFHVEGNKKIVMLTADTYRIAATEQLRTYANILGVPFNVVYSAEDLKNYVTQFKEYDFILVDTAGHSHKNKEQTGDILKLLNCLGDSVEKEIYLVISAATKYRDLIKIVDTYNNMIDYNIIFTKLDETTSLGNILNIKMYSGKELAYVTLGQNVPDDIEIFDAQSLVKQLLGGQ
ncbi:flagellar biosynthesis protein FlhF [Lachnotalea glycerini]|uniref:Flagellar biosynthesis protein FlhF n=1 Tax=Lachnotalea glycerini TaxID=1763509 RepID=A0A318EZC0_9FIRM|nr:flagellar biosynthesis protein FlhF [Lachnotalea glycerini]PXV93524.1 flagellar biosynthesis protein FlhF [Lachnotalea glycerini]